MSSLPYPPTPCPPHPLWPVPAPRPHPPSRYDTRKDVKFEKDAPVIGLVLQRSHLVTGDHGHYDGVVAELEARGAKASAADACAAAAAWAAVVLLGRGRGVPRLHGTCACRRACCDGSDVALPVSQPCGHCVDGS